MEDLDSDGEDHIADETRYFLMSRPIKPRLGEKGNGRGALELLLDIPGGALGAKTPIKRMEILND